MFDVISNGALWIVEALDAAPGLWVAFGAYVLGCISAWFAARDWFGILLDEKYGALEGLSMNRKRRKRIEKIKDRIAEIADELEGHRAELEEIREEELEAFENMPESLQASIRGNASEEAMISLDEADAYLGDAVCGSLKEAIEALESAIE